MLTDDAKVFCSDPHELQACLDYLDEILKSYQLNLAPHKCFILPISKRSHQNSLNNHQNLSINSTNLPFEHYARDLGIYITKDLKWELHINRIAKQASFASYRIIKSFHSKNVWTLLKLYKCYVRPKLEYNTPVWSPYLIKDINTIENVQKRFVKIICRRCNIPSSSYSDRLTKLNLPSLQCRRVRFDLITMFKIINNMSNLNFDSFFVIKYYPYPLRNRPSQILPKQHFNDSIWVGSFFERAPRYWNKLSQDITSISSLNLFKTRLKSISFVTF